MSDLVGVRQVFLCHSSLEMIIDEALPVNPCKPVILFQSVHRPRQVVAEGVTLFAEIFAFDLLEKL